MPVTSILRLPFQCADGASNMAADELALHAAADRGVAALRFYQWSGPTLSLGYFQSAAVRGSYPRLASLPWVRRASGGKALIHHHELTYALTLPPGFDADWMARMHRRVLLPALNALGLSGLVQIVDKPHRLGEGLCFLDQTPGDLICAGAKIVGSAQRKYRQALLQHGAILLERSDFAPELPGIKDLAGVTLALSELQGAITAEFCRETGWRLEETALDLAEETWAERIEHYRSAAWNEKR